MRLHENAARLTDEVIQLLLRAIKQGRIGRQKVGIHAVDQQMHARVLLHGDLNAEEDAKIRARNQLRGVFVFRDIPRGEGVIISVGHVIFLIMIGQHQSVDTDRTSLCDHLLGGNAAAFADTRGMGVKIDQHNREILSKKG